MDTPSNPSRIDTLDDDKTREEIPRRAANGGLNQKESGLVCERISVKRRGDRACARGSFISLMLIEENASVGTT